MQSDADGTKGLPSLNRRLPHPIDEGNMMHIQDRPREAGGDGISKELQLGDLLTTSESKTNDPKDQAQPHRAYAFEDGTS